MTKLDVYLFLIGLEIVSLVGIVWALQDKDGPKRALSIVFTVLLGFMLTHVVGRIVPDYIAGLIYCSDRNYRSIKDKG